MYYFDEPARVDRDRNHFLIDALLFFSASSIPPAVLLYLLFFSFSGKKIIRIRRDREEEDLLMTIIVFDQVPLERAIMNLLNEVRRSGYKKRSLIVLWLFINVEIVFSSFYNEFLRMILMCNFR